MHKSSGGGKEEKKIKGFFRALLHARVQVLRPPFCFLFFCF